MANLMNPFGQTEIKDINPTQIGEINNAKNNGPNLIGNQLTIYNPILESYTQQHHLVA